jgi:hypothetical protein
MRLLQHWESAGPTAGLALTHQGTGCVFPRCASATLNFRNGAERVMFDCICYSISRQPGQTAGLALTHQGTGCVFAKYVSVEGEDVHLTACATAERL